MCRRRIAFHPTVTEQTMPATLAWKSMLRTYGLATLLGAAVFALAFQPWNARRDVPFSYSNGGDVHFHLMLFKTIVETGWYTVNPNLGAPGVMNLHDFPYIETGMVLLARLLAVFCHDPFIIANLYFALTYLIIIWIALYVLRALAVSDSIAVAASLLYAFAPYHIWRGATHPHLSSYFCVPLAVLAALWLARGEPLLLGPRARRLPVLFTCILIALGGPYYGAFGLYLLAVGGLIGWLRRPGFRRAIDPLLPIGLIGLLLAAQMVPFWLYWYRYGANPAASHRLSGSAQILGMRLYHLFKPVAGHRLPWLADSNLALLQERAGNILHVYTYTLNETAITAPLGLVAAVGFALLLLVAVAWPIRRPVVRRAHWLKDLAGLNLAALLLAQSGGLGELIARYLSPRLRAYNRMSIVIAFLSLSALAVLAQEFQSRRWASRWLPMVVAFVLVLGLLDQIPPAALPDYSRDAAMFNSDRAFVGRVEAAVPPGSQIFQLPPNSFPEFGMHFEMPDYSLFRGYLHSTRLRWSFGAVRGRAAQEWQSRLAPLPVPALVQALRKAGFAGIYVNRRGHRGRAAALERELRRELGSVPLISTDGQLSFFQILPKP
jgi:phosphoglycerol transferase